MVPIRAIDALAFKVVVPVMPEEAPPTLFKVMTLPVAVKLLSAVVPPRVPPNVMEPVPAFTVRLCAPVFVSIVPLKTMFPPDKLLLIDAEPRSFRFVL